MKQYLLRCLALSLFIGALLGSALMWIAWQENAQCEIHCPEVGIDWAYWLAIGGTGLVMGFVLCMAMALLGRGLYLLLIKP